MADYLRRFIIHKDTNPPQLTVDFATDDSFNCFPLDGIQKPEELEHFLNRILEIYIKIEEEKIADRLINQEEPLMTSRLQDKIQELKSQLKEKENDCESLSKAWRVNQDALSTVCYQLAKKEIELEQYKTINT